MLTKTTHPAGRRQRGMATLTTAIMVLFLITIIVLYAGKTAVFEQNVAANQFRADQALAAANAGLDYGLAYAGDTNSTTTCTFASHSGTACAKTITAGGQSLTFEIFYCSMSAVSKYPVETVIANSAACGTPAASGSAGENAVVAIGYSDDKSARRILIQGVAAAQLLGQSPSSPLSTRGSVGLTGNITIINRYLNFSIWTSQSSSAWGSGASYLRPKAFELQTTAACESHFPNSPDSKHRCYTDGTTWLDHAQLVEDAVNNDYSQVYSNADYGNNIDVITDDPNLRPPALEDGELFAAIFNGQTKVSIETMAKNNNQWFTGVPTSGLSGITWVNPTSGTLSLNGGTYGSVTQPIMLVVNGDCDTTGNLTIYGLLYVIGDWNTHGNVTIQGAVVIEGAATAGTGSNMVIYDPVALDNINSSPNKSLLVGTWRDW